MRYTLMLTMLSLLAAGCSDSETKPKTDGPGTHHEASTTDGPGTHHEASTTDGPGTHHEAAVGNKSCFEVGECAKACVDMACVTTCLASGCTEAQTLATALVTCAMTSCTICATGFSEACVTCLETSCPTQYSACEAHTSCE